MTATRASTLKERTDNARLEAATTIIALLGWVIWGAMAVYYNVILAFVGAPFSAFGWFVIEFPLLAALIHGLIFRPARVRQSHIGLALAVVSFLLATGFVALNVFMRFEGYE